MSLPMGMARCDGGCDYKVDTTVDAKDIRLDDAVTDQCFLHVCADCGDRRWAPTHRNGEQIWPDVASWPKVMDGEPISFNMPMIGGPPCNDPMEVDGTQPGVEPVPMPEYQWPMAK